MIEQQSLTKIEVHKIVGDALFGVTRQDILGLYCFLTEADDEYWFAGEEVTATLQTNEEEDPIALQIKCDRTNTTLDFDYFTHQARMEIEWAIDMLKTWLNDGYGLDW